MQLRIPFVTLIKIGATVLLGYLLFRLWTVVLLFAFAVLLAIVLDPVVVWLEQHRVRRPFAVLAVAAGVLLLLAAFFGVLVPMMARQVLGLDKELPQILHRLESMFPALGPLLERLQGFPGQTQKFLTTGFLAGKLLLEGVTAIVLVYVIAMYVLVEGRRVYLWLIDFAPARNRKRVDQTCREVADVVRSYLRGATITAFICAVYVLVVLSVLHVPLVLVLAVLAFVFDFVPVIGTIVMAVPAALLALLVSPGRALIVAGAYLPYHGVEAYVLVPRIYGRQMRLSTLTVLVAMTIGVVLQGPIGAVLSLPVAAAYPIVERIWLRGRLPPDTVRLHETMNDERTT